MNNQKYNIICLSNQLWDFPNWTNKRHVMTRLGKLGYNVLFVDPPINAGRVFLKQIKQKKWSVQRLLTQTKTDPQSNVKVYTPINLLPFSDITSSLHVKAIQKHSQKHFSKDLPTVLWIYHVQIPYIQKYLDELVYDFLVYDCVDNYSAFPENSAFYKASVDKSTTISQENELAQRADVIFASAPGLVDKMKEVSKNPAKVYFTPNVGDYEKFNQVSRIVDIPAELKEIPRPRIGFTGALDEYKFDKELFRMLAKTYPQYSFVLIGPLALKDKEASLADLGLEDQNNVHLLGSRDYSVIENYFAGFDAFIIPYQLNEYTVGGCFPVKFHDALAAGLPVVVTDMPAYYPFDDVCYISKSYGDFSQNLKKALDEDSPEKIKQRKNIAKENNWDGKVSKMITIIGEKLQ